jgi:hypothetical protein
MARSYHGPMPQALSRRVPAWQHPRLLAALGVASAAAAVGAAVVGAWRGGPANVLAVVLVLLSVALSFRALRIAGRYELGLLQRGTLLRSLGRLAPLEVQVSAVDDRDAVDYARGLRDVMNEARWPATGVFKCAQGTQPAGVTLVVRNVVAPPGEAVVLQDTLRRTGVHVGWGHRADLADDRTIEVRVGRLR